MRLAWLSSTAQFYAPALGLAMIGVAVIAWLAGSEGALLLTLLVTLIYLLVLLAGALILRISIWDASRTADRGLHARDVFTTALEFHDENNDVHREIQARAERIAAEADPGEAVPISVDRRRLRRFALAAAAALAIGVLPPFGSTPAISSDLQTALEAEAEEIERIAEAVRDADVDNADEIAEELESLAEELRTAPDLDSALEALAEADARLETQLDPTFLAQKAAVQGLATDLTLRPLVSDAPLDAASQLTGLADELAELSEPELRALADRLADMAASQAAGNPALSTSLAEASSALSAGDLGAAAQSLRDAAGEQQSGLSSARSQQAVTETQRALEGVAARLGGQGQGDEGGEGSGEGTGQGQGEGNGQGSGQGGQGAGNGSGQGGSPQGGGASGAISGVAPGAGGAAGQGGQGTVGSGGKGEFGTEVETSSVFSPIDRGDVSDLIQVGIDGGSGQGDIVGRADGPTQRGESVVPYAQVLPEYLNEAADALSALQLPPSMREIVQSYFGLLADQAR